jgi:hypothetical protein
MKIKQLIILAYSMLVLVACKNEIGDDCQADVDCSANMDRNCDRSQPGGYCLEIGCAPDDCPKEAVCVEYTTPCPNGMDLEACQLIEPNRGRNYCLKHCKKSGDCREKYTCTEPDDLYGTITDLNTSSKKICVPKSDT